MKRKQYDTYGAAGFNSSRGAGQQQYYRAGGTTIDPEELFRKIFGEFSGMGFGGVNSMFEQRPEVSPAVFNFKPFYASVYLLFFLKFYMLMQYKHFLFPCSL